MELKDLRSVCVVLLLCVASTLARFLNDTQNENSSIQGACFYNGTWYEEKEELPTRGLCLICHCFPGFTEPNAFTCAVIDCPWDDYHKRFPGCTPIYADRDCCPIGWECDYGTQNPGQQLSKDPECDCEWRYLKHYEAKGCRPVYEEKPDVGKSECTCPWRFDCSQADEVNSDEKACVYKKHVYPVGSKIPTTNTCEQCSCTTDYFTQAATITCVTTECPSVYSQTPLPEGCHYVYKEKECCPTTVECPAKEKENTYKVPVCEYKGKMYYEGEQIYPDEDPCLICLCNSNWTGINSTTCRQHDCMLERDSRKLKQGCIPIYHEKTCCPIDYHCSDDDFEFKVNRGSNFKSEDDEDEMCHFEGRYYPIGHVLDIKHPTHCVTCTCKTPPDFTCIHSSCPPPPNGDYTHCRAVYKPNACCPDYKCHEKKGPSCPDPICQGTNCWLETREDGCAVCRCKSRCVPCPEMCRPEKADNPCSGCICQINATALSQDAENSKSEEETTEAPSEDSLQILIQECKKMECASNERCMLVEKKCDGKKCSPAPQCEKVSFGCGQKSCPEGCEEIGSYENSCPICYCKKEIKESQYKLTCHVQSCEENCVLTGRDQDGCPLCKCPQGNLEERACAQSSCKGYNCTMIVNALGCAECRCQLSCKPRECPAGCDMDLDVPRDSGLECGCTCKNSTTALEFIHSKPIPDSCKLVSCEGLNCTVGEDQSGCPTCICKSPCPEPECQEGCQIEKDVEPGRCPGCVCKLSRSARDNTAKECPPPTCLGYNCSVMTGDDGCQKCFCESPCEENPQCPSHCELEAEAPEGRCRGCICSYGEESDAENSRGEGGASANEESDGEPEKREDHEADFIPMPGKDIVPGIDKIYLVHGDNNQDQYGNIPGYHYDAGHAFPVGEEHLGSILYNSDGKATEKSESGHPETFSDDLHEEASEDKHTFEEYDDEDKYDHVYAEEKTIDDEQDEKCAQKNCPEGQKCVIRRLQCIRTPCPTIPVCIDVEPRCPIPMCSIGCMVMKWDDEVCPSCFCGIIRGAEGRVCPRTRCIGQRCYNVIGDDGCPTCKCDSICIPPTCADGCWIETDPPEGKCPTCTCPQRSTVVPQIIPGTSPAITTLEPNLETGKDSEYGTDSSGPSEYVENNEDKPASYFEEDAFDAEPSFQDTTTEIPENNSDKVLQDASLINMEEKEPSTIEPDTLDFYNSLAEIEEQVRTQPKLTTVTVNLPTEFETSDLFDTTTGIITDDSDFEQVNTFSHHNPATTGAPLTSTSGNRESLYKLKTTLSPTTESTSTSATDLVTEKLELTAKPCMSVPTTKTEATKSSPTSAVHTIATTTTVKHSPPSNEYKITQKVRKPTTPSVHTTRKPQRKQPNRHKPSIASSTNKAPTTHRIRPQEGHKIKPKPQMNVQIPNNQSTENLKTRPVYHVQHHKRRPINRPEPSPQPVVVQEVKNITEDPNGMKPILQNLQELMSNLNNVLSSHQNPLHLQQSATVGAETQEVSESKPLNQTTEVMKKTPNVKSSHDGEEIHDYKLEIQSSDENKNISESFSTETIPSDNDKKSNQNLNGQKQFEQENQKVAKDPEVQNEPTPQYSGIPNNLYQQYYGNNPNWDVNNPNIQSLISSHHMLSNPQYAQYFQQNMKPQYPMYPHFAYQSTSGGIPGYGFIHQPQISNVPYQSHIPPSSPHIMHSQPSIINPLNAQSTGQSAQSQTSFYPSIQQVYPSNIPSSTDHYSHTSTQIQNPHLLLTNIPLPQSLQQQLQAGTQTLGFLQYLLKPNEQTVMQQNVHQSQTTSSESSTENVHIAQTETQSSQISQQNIQKNNLSSEIQQRVSSTSPQQSENAHASVDSDDKGSLHENNTTEPPNQNEANEALSNSQQTQSSSVNQLSQHNKPEEYTMPPFPETSSTTVSTIINENKLSTSSVFYEGGSFEENMSTQQPDTDIPLVMQQFNHHAPQAQQTFYLNTQDKVLPAVQNEQKDASQNLEKQKLTFHDSSINQQPSALDNSNYQHSIVQNQSNFVSQLNNLQQNQMLGTDQHLKPTSQGLSSSSTFFSSPHQEDSLQKPDHKHDVEQNHDVHITAHFRPLDASHASSQWQHSQNEFSNANDKPSEQNKIQENRPQQHVSSFDIPNYPSDTILNLNSEKIKPISTEYQVPNADQVEKSSAPYGQQHIHSNEGREPLQGQQIEVQIVNLQNQSQYQHNFYQQYPGSHIPSATEKESIRTQVHNQNHEEYQKPSSFIHSETKPEQGQSQKEIFPSQQQNIQFHYISNHNLHGVQFQPVNKHQHIHSQDEVPINLLNPLQHNEASSSSPYDKNQNQHFGDHVAKPPHQDQSISATHIHLSHPSLQQKEQHLQTQENIHMSQQIPHFISQQYSPPKPVQEHTNSQEQDKGQLDFQQYHHQTYMTHTPQQSQLENTYVTSQSQSQQQEKVAGMNVPIATTEVKHGIQGPSFVQPVLNQNTQYQIPQQNYFQSQHSVPQHQQQHYIHTPEKNTQAHLPHQHIQQQYGTNPVIEAQTPNHQQYVPNESLKNQIQHHSGTPSVQISHQITNEPHQVPSPSASISSHQQIYQQLPNQNIMSAQKPQHNQEQQNFNVELNPVVPVQNQQIFSLSEKPFTSQGTAQQESTERLQKIPEDGQYFGHSQSIPQQLTEQKLGSNYAQHQTQHHSILQNNPLSEEKLSNHNIHQIYASQNEKPVHQQHFTYQQNPSFSNHQSYQQLNANLKPEISTGVSQHFNQNSEMHQQKFQQSQSHFQSSVQHTNDDLLSQLQTQQHMFNQESAQGIQQNKQQLNSEQSHNQELLQHPTNHFSNQQSVSVSQNQQFINQQPTKSPDNHQQFLTGEQLPQIISTEPQIQQFVNQRPTQQNQESYITSENFSDRLSSVQHQIFSNKPSTSSVYNKQQGQYQYTNPKPTTFIIENQQAQPSISSSTGINPLNEQQMQQSLNQQSVYAPQNHQQHAFSGQYPDSNQQVQNILPLNNQQLTNIQQNQQQYILSQQPTNIISSVQQIHQFNNQQPTNFMQQQQQYGTSQQSVSSTIPSQQIQQSINQQLTNIPQSQQHYIVPEQSSIGSPQVQQIFNQLPTKIPQQQQQHIISQQSPDTIAEQQTHHFTYQQPVSAPQIQHQYVSPEQTSDSKTTAHQVQQFINKQPTEIPQFQQQYNIPVQTSNIATSAQQPQQFINNEQLKTSQNQQQFVISNQGSDISYPSQVHQFVSQETTKTPHNHQQYILAQQVSTVSTEQHIPHFSDRQPTKTPQTQQQYTFSQQSQGNIHSDQQIKQFINQKTTKTPQTQQQYATAETSDHTSSKHHTQQFNYQQIHPSQNQQQFISTGQLQDNLHKQQQSQYFINAEDKADIPKDSTKNKLAPIPNQSASIPQTLSSEENQNSKISEFVSDSSHSQQSEQYFVDLDHDPEHSQYFQQEFQNEEQTQETNIDESAISYQQFHEDQNNNEDTHQHQFQQQHNEDRYSALKPIAQIVTADPQVNADHDRLHNEEYAHDLHSNKKPVQQFSANTKKNESVADVDMKLTQHSVSPFDPETTKTHAIKSRPSVTPHPHFHPVGYQPSPEPEDPSHDLFPAPSRPLKQKPEIHQEDWVDQEFVEEEDIHHEPEAYEDIEYDDYETPPPTTTTTTTTTTTKRPMHIKRKPSRRPPIRFSPPTQSTTTTTTTSKPHQQEFIESFDNHQPDYKKPIDLQEFIDEYETTTPKKYTYFRPTTTRRPSTKSPIKFSFPAVSPTAEAYGLKKEQTTKVPVNPFASYPCPTPHCNGYNCSLIRGSDGCQKCVCDSPCAPCPQHCVKTKTMSEGRCPICDCTGVAATAISDSQHCPVIECGGTNCRKVRDNNGCYTCICDPQCAEPKCDPGCEVLTNVPPGQCPGCVCRVTVVQAVVNRPKNCPAVQCTGPLCRTTRGPDGCLQCLCDPCPPPKCDPGCELQTDVAQGQCPTCVCPSFNDDDTDQEEEPYCPNLFCADYGCREVTGPAGCPICMCDPICETPVCDAGCEVVTNKHMGKCPVCICSSPHAGIDNSSYSLDGIKTAQQEPQHPVTFSANDADENETELEPEPTEEYVHEEEITTTTTEPTTTTTEITTTTEPTTTTCPAPVCSGLRCSYETSEDGCEVCKCRYKCPTPKCVGNCYAETNAPAHRCPGCVCPSRRKPPTP